MGILTKVRVPPMNMDRIHRFFRFSEPNLFQTMWGFAFPIGFRVCTLAPLGPDDNVLLGTPRVLFRDIPFHTLGSIHWKVKQGETQTTSWD